MKKAKLLVLSLLAVSAMSLSGCGSQGEAGPKGDKGDQGTPGEKGDQGVPGKDGEDGSSFLNGEGAPASALGNDGDTYLDTKSFDLYVKVSGAWVKKGNIKGAQGEKGDTGSTGSTGSQGATAWANTILPSDGGYILADKGSAVINEKVTFTFIPKSGYTLSAYTFDGWKTGYTELTKEKVVVETTMKNNGFVVGANFAKDDEHTIDNNDTSVSIEDDGYTLLKGLKPKASITFNTSNHPVILDSGTFNGLPKGQTVYSKIEIPENKDNNTIKINSGVSLSQYDLDIEGKNNVVSIAATYTYLNTATIKNNSTMVIEDGASVSLSNVDLDTGAKIKIKKGAKVVFYYVGLKGESSIEIEDGAEVSINYNPKIESGKITGEYNDSTILSNAICLYNTNNWDSSTGTLTIPEGIKKIGSYVLFEHGNKDGKRWDKNNGGQIKKIILPSTLETIEDNAFSNCKEVEEIVWPESNTLKYIGNSAFITCSSLKQISLPNTLEYVGNEAFRNCEMATQVKLVDNNKTTYGAYVFRGCKSLNTITIPDNCTQIGERMFQDCHNKDNKSGNVVGKYGDGLTSVTLPATLQKVGLSAFDNCDSLKTVVLNGGATTYGETIFSGCDALETVTLPEGLTEIKTKMFYLCKALKTINLPNTLTTIGNSAFEGCTGLNSISFPAFLTTINGSAFKGCTGLNGTNIASSKVFIPSNVTTIGKNAFNGIKYIRCEAASTPTGWNTEWCDDVSESNVKWSQTK